MRTPYNIDYCKAVKCSQRKGNKCTMPECIRNHKRILFWEQYGVLAKGDTVDAGPEDIPY